MQRTASNPESPASLLEQLDDCLLQDRWRLGRQLRALRSDPKKTSESAARIENIAAAIARSRSLAERRRAASVKLEFDEQLPVAAARQEILDAIASYQVLIVCGETGSGKTTQLPRLCLAAGRGIFGRIGHTQPRRIAARAVARRVAAETGSSLGEVVGYQTRFDKQLEEHSRVKVMTDGILLAELRRDRWLNQYDTLIIDEAHERSLNIDFLLGYLHRLLKKRKDLKLIITSATLETDKFSRHFDDAPVLEISGRMYPVDIEYLDDEDDDDAELADRVATGVKQLLAAKSDRGNGDILVFLPGERQIAECRQVLRQQFGERLEVLPLFGRLSASDQDRVFARKGKTRCVLATNIAETSLTVPGIRYVVDSGLARISRYSVRSKVQQLPIEKISQASARQRAGRCGRLENGLCLRLYSERDLLARPEHTDAEILRTNLARVILAMTSLRLGNIEDFPFVDSPDGRRIRDGYRLLTELEALNGNGEISKLGRQMSELPLDPRIARMLLAARDAGCLEEMRIIAAALSIPDPRQRPAENRSAADEVHGHWDNEHSDMLALLALWRNWRAAQKELSRGALRRWCKEHFLSYPRMREWQDLVHQLHGQVKGTDAATAVDDKAHYERLHRALLAGLLSHVGERDEEGGYQGTRGRQFFLFPGSGVDKSKARWVLAAQLIETSRLFAHVNAMIEPAWIEQAAAHLVKRQHDEPQWDPASGRVVARESVTLYGLTLVAGRLVDYGPVNPVHAREIFIRAALVEHDLSPAPAFLQHNLATETEIRELEARLRREDLLITQQARAELYVEALPAKVRDQISLQAWLKRAGKKALESLKFSKDALMARQPDSLELYPDHLQVDRNRIALEYAFERGAKTDGVTAEIPLGLLNALQASDFDYLVPGLLEEKLVALLKGLPKAQRKRFVPVPDYARALLESLPEERPPLLPWVAARLAAMTGATISAADLAAVKLDNHLRMHFRVLDEEGETRASGRDLAELKEELSGVAGAAALPEAAARHERDGIRRWDFGELKAEVVEQHHGQSITLFPALQDEGTSVSLVLCDHAWQAARVSRNGVARLAWLALPQQIKLLMAEIRSRRQRLLSWRRYGEEADLLHGVVWHLAGKGLCMPEPPRTEPDFADRLNQFRASVVAEAEQLLDLLESVLALDSNARQLLAELAGGPAASQAEDAQRQLDALMHPGFLAETEAHWLARYPVYLEALLLRLEKLPAGQDRDQAAKQSLDPLLARWQGLPADVVERFDNRHLREFRWLLEELRISLFAQQLRTVRKVSVVRLERLWREKIAPALEQAGLTPGH